MEDLTFKKELKEKCNQIYADNKVTFGGGEAEYTVKDILKYKQGGSVLEIGAGEGRNSLFLAVQGFDVEAIDISDREIAKLQEAAEKQNLKIKTHAIDIDLFIPDKNYDVIILTFVLHLMAKERALYVMDLMKGWANPGGINVISGFTKDGDFYKNNPGTDKFYLEKEELKDIYKDWEILEYSEKSDAAFQKKDDGSPMFNVSARILARKLTP